MNSQAILTHYAKQGKWSKAQQLSVLLEFVDTIEMQEALKEFLLEALARDMKARAETDLLLAKL
jgi:hypothetical protein